MVTQGLGDSKMRGVFGLGLCILVFVLWSWDFGLGAKSQDPSPDQRPKYKAPSTKHQAHLPCTQLLSENAKPMRWSRYFIPTLREDPADAEVISHKLLLRAGVIRQLSAGIYSLLPLGQRIALKVMQILREEMNAIGGQEFYLPALHPAEIWQESGRWYAIGDEMFRLKDRKGTDMCLGMTHEEVSPRSRATRSARTNNCRRSGIRCRSSFATKRGPSRV